MSLLLLFGGGGGGGGGPTVDGGLARIHDRLSLTLIRKLGDTGGPRGDQIEEELNNIITWAALSSRCIHRDTDTVGNVGAGEDALHSYTLPAASLTTDGDYVSGEASGGIANNDTDKSVRFYVDGTAQIAPPTIDLDGAQGWVLRYKIVRLTSTSVRITATMIIDVVAIDSGGAATITTGFFAQANNADLSVSDLDANGLLIEVTGEGGADNDVTQNLTIIELNQQ